MVVALVPELRGPMTPRWILYFLSDFVAITSWVLAMKRLRGIPCELRTSYYARLGSTLVLFNMCVTAVVYLVGDSLLPSISAALFLLAPMYFLTSLWRGKSLSANGQGISLWSLGSSSGRFSILSWQASTCLVQA